jgi:exonuclease SbcD
MRLLHTADWHLGRAFHGEDLLGAQAALVDFVVDAARGAGVDGVLIAGDLYDRALPPVDAVRLADEALTRLAEVAPVVVISGNHDSAARLGFGAGLLARADVHLRTDPLAAGSPVALGDGLIYPVPYLEPDLVRAALGVEERTHAAAMRAAMDRVRADVAARGSGPTRAPVVVTAHAFVAGGMPSESERDLAVGGAATVPALAFDGADYVALGHLHGPQMVGGGLGRYAGSPLALSFSEAGQAKSVAVIEVVAGALPLVELLPCPVPRPLANLRGTLDALLADPRLADAEGAWVQATLTDPVRPADAMERLRRRFPHAVALAFDPQGAGSRPEDSYQRLRGLDDDELVQRFVSDTRGREADDDELALLRDALTARRVAEAVA